jgi:hypothetical protein
MFHGIFQSINDARPAACARRRKIIELATMARPLLIDVAWF